jgi:SAM-dependent methyltransferase
LKVSIGSPLPFDDNSVDSVSAFDFLEHLPRLGTLGPGSVTTYIDWINEIGRVLRPGGVFIAFTPRFPHPASVADPTHVNFITRDSVNYIAGPAWAKVLGYGLTANFAIVTSKPVFGSTALLQKSLIVPPSKKTNPLGSIFLKIRDVFWSFYSNAPSRSHMLWVLEKC